MFLPTLSCRFWNCCGISTGKVGALLVLMFPFQQYWNWQLFNFEDHPPKGNGATVLLWSHYSSQALWWKSHCWVWVLILQLAKILSPPSTYDLTNPLIMRMVWNRLMARRVVQRITSCNFFPAHCCDNAWLHLYVNILDLGKICCTTL